MPCCLHTGKAIALSRRHSKTVVVCSLRDAFQAYPLLFRCGTIRPCSTTHTAASAVARVVSFQNRHRQAVISLQACSATHLGWLESVQLAGAAWIHALNDAVQPDSYHFAGKCLVYQHWSYPSVHLHHSQHSESLPWCASLCQPGQ